MSRKLVAGLFVSLDGVAESPDKFVFPFFSPEVGAEVGRNMEASDTMLLGRKTYEEWAAYWPGKTADDDEYAPYINNVPKFVASTTLNGPLEWNNSTLLQGELATAVNELKDQPGKEIAVTGSITLIGSLAKQGLLDELSLLVFPVLVGTGKRLFEDTDGQVPLQLVESKQLDTGVVSLRYAGKE